MQSFWDLLPASLWPTQPFISPDEQTRILAAAHSLGLPSGSPSFLPLDAAAPNPALGALPPAPQPPPATPAGSDDLAATAAAPSANPGPSPGEPPLRVIAGAPITQASPLGILGAIFGWEPPRAPAPAPAPTPAPAPPPSYGVDAKNLPPSFRLPPPLSSWQKPEPDTSWGSPYALDLFGRAQAHGLDLAVLPLYAPGRERRDFARAFNFVLPGTGNFVSGDWDNITDTDVVNFGRSLGTTLTLGLPGLEGAAVRAELGAAARVAAADEAARAAAVRARAVTGAFGGKLDPAVDLRAFPIEPSLVRPAEPVVDPGDSGGGADAAAEPGAMPRVPPLPAARPVPAPTSVLDDANYAQRWYDEEFSDKGPYAGRTINDLLADLHSGALAPSDLEVRYIVRDGHTLIQNTRTSQVLERAGIPRWQWNAVNKTGDPKAERDVSRQLARNGLTSEGTPTVKTREEWLKAGNPLWPTRTR